MCELLIVYHFRRIVGKDEWVLNANPDQFHGGMYIFPGFPNDGIRTLRGDHTSILL